MRDLMPFLLLGVYSVLLVLQVVVLVWAVRRRSRGLWLRLMALETGAAALAAAICAYYNSLPGYGFMPGFSYLGEVLFSFFAAIAYGAMLAVTLVTGLIRKLQRK